MVYSLLKFTRWSARPIRSTTSAGTGSGSTYGPAMATTGGYR